LSLRRIKYQEQFTFHAHDEPRPILAFSLDSSWGEGGKLYYASREMSLPKPFKGPPNSSMKRELLTSLIQFDIVYRGYPA
jgi:hypothetical protein